MRETNSIHEIELCILRSRREDKIKPDKDLIVWIATIDELKKNGFKEWFEVGAREVIASYTSRNQKIDTYPINDCFIFF